MQKSVNNKKTVTVFLLKINMIWSYSRCFNIKGVFIGSLYVIYQHLWMLTMPSFLVYKICKSHKEYNLWNDCAALLHNTENRTHTAEINITLCASPTNTLCIASGTAINIIQITSIDLLTLATLKIFFVKTMEANGFFSIWNHHKYLS